MLKSFKAEINPSKEQIVKINKTIGTCRYVYNFYLAHNKDGWKIKSGTVSKKAGRYYVSVLIEIPDTEVINNNS